MTTAPDLHDLVIRTVAEYLVGKNKTLCALQRVNARFYGVRDIFISQLALSERASVYAYKKRVYGWNMVYSMILHGRHEINDLSALGRVRVLRLISCYQIHDVSALKEVHTLILFNSSDVKHLNTLPKLRHLSLLVDYIPINRTAIKKLHSLTIDDCRLESLGIFIGIDHLIIQNTFIHPSANMHLLKKSRTLTFRHCKFRHDISTFSSIHTLIFDDCIGISYLSALIDVHSLTILASHEIQDISTLHAIPHLTIKGCAYIPDMHT